MGISEGFEKWLYVNCGLSLEQAFKTILDDRNI
jgi:hypothetical protein